jgi:hypothetical protein
MDNEDSSTLFPVINPRKGPLHYSALFSNHDDDQVGSSPGLTESSPLAQHPCQESVAPAEGDEGADELLSAFDRPSERDTEYTFLTLVPRSQLIDACKKWKVASYGRKDEIVRRLFHGMESSLPLRVRRVHL